MGPTIADAVVESRPHFSATETTTHSQVSSVPSVDEKWLNDTFWPALKTTQIDDGHEKHERRPSPARHSLIVPSAAIIRQSVTGYKSGASSIHMKTSTPAQKKQVAFLHPFLRHWGPPERGSLTDDHLSSSHANLMTDSWTGGR